MHPRAATDHAFGYAVAAVQSRAVERECNLRTGADQCRCLDCRRSRLISKTSRRPTTCEYRGFLIFSQDVDTPSVSYRPSRHLPTMPSRSQSQTALNRAVPRHKSSTYSRRESIRGMILRTRRLRSTSGSSWYAPQMCASLTVAAAYDERERDRVQPQTILRFDWVLVVQLFDYVENVSLHVGGAPAARRPRQCRDRLDERPIEHAGVFVARPSQAEHAILSLGVAGR